jgi:cell shape-determining protein MreD
MKRSPLVHILVPVLVILHFLLHLGMGIGRSAPDLLTLALLLAVREMGMGWAAGLGFFFGLLEDSFSGLAFGASTLALTLVGALGSRTRDLFVGDSLLFFFFYLTAGKWLRDLLHWIATGEAGREPFLNAVLVDGSMGALYVALVGLLLLLPFGGREALR